MYVAMIIIRFSKFKFPTIWQDEFKILIHHPTPKLMIIIEVISAAAVLSFL